MFRSRFLAAFVAGILVAACQTTEGVRTDNIPMYGQPDVVRSAAQRQADRDFIEEAVKGFASRREASSAWWRQGVRFVRKGNLDYAMRRHNQAWLLDPGNYQPYWGFGMVFLNQDKTAEAIPYLKRALSLVDEDKQKVHLLGDLGLTYATDASINRSAGNLARGSESFRSANNSFLEAVKLEPGYARTYRAWAWSLFEEGRYAEAWNKVKIGQKLKEGLIGVGFLYKLSRKMPEPN